MVHGRLMIVSNSKDRSRIATAINPDDWKSEAIELGTVALTAAQELQPPIVLLDARRVDHCHTLFCQTFRGMTELQSILLFGLTSEHCIDERHRLLEAGADDCWSDAVGSDAFALRLKAIHRQLYPPRTAGLLRRMGIELDMDCYRVRVDGSPIQLTATQILVLKHLMERPGVTVSALELLERFWDSPNLDEGRVITCMRRLRRILARAGRPEAIRRVQTSAFILD